MNKCKAAKLARNFMLFQFRQYITSALIFIAPFHCGFKKKLYN